VPQFHHFQWIPLPTAGCLSADTGCVNPLASANDSARARLFIALWPGDAARKALVAYQSEWAWPRGAALVAAERLHLTLHFLGAVARDRLPELTAGLRVPSEGFDLCLERSELWAGGIAVLRPGVAPHALTSLHERLGDALRKLDQPTDDKPFTPHVTLARRAKRAVPPQESPNIHWRVDGYALVESLSQPLSGYRVLHRW